MASIPGALFHITGASGSQGLLAPRSSWRAYVFPRGGYASQDSTGTLITFDSADVASRFAVNNWIQRGLATADIRQVSAVGGNSISVSGAALTVTENDRIYLIGNTQPSTAGGSATYTVPATIIRQRDDDAADIYTNSMITSNADGLVQFFGAAALYDVLIQDSNQTNQGSVIDLELGTVEGVSVSTTTVFGVTVTFLAGVSMNTTLIVGQTVTLNSNIGITGSMTVAGGVTISAGAANIRPYLITPRFGEVSGASSGGAIRVVDGSLFPATSAGIQTAVSDLAPNGGMVLLLGRTYTVTSEVTLTSRVTIQGSGRATVLDPAGFTGNVFGIRASNIQHWAINDLSIIDSTEARTATGLNLMAAANNAHSLWTMRNVHMRYLSVGIRGSTSDTQAGNTIELSGVHIRDCGVGVELLGNDYGSIHFCGCAMTNGTSWGVHYGGRQLGTEFSGCDIENNVGAEVYLDGAADVTFTGCHFENSGATPSILIYPDSISAGVECEAISVVGGGFGGNGAPAAWVEIGDGVAAGGKLITFFNNFWSGGASAGIRARTPRTFPTARVYDPWRVTIPNLLDTATGTSNVVGVFSRTFGWTASSGTAARTGFDTATVGLTTLAQHVKALLDDLTLQGIIGATQGV